VKERDTKLDGIAETMRQHLLDVLDERLQPYFEAIEAEFPGLDREAYAAELERRVDVETMFEQICDEYREMLIGGKLQ
jgi:hypothetical protein